MAIELTDRVAFPQLTSRRVRLSRKTWRDRGTLPTGKCSLNMEKRTSPSLPSSRVRLRLSKLRAEHPARWLFTRPARLRETSMFSPVARQSILRSPMGTAKSSRSRPVVIRRMLCEVPTLSDKLLEAFQARRRLLESLGLCRDSHRRRPQIRKKFCSFASSSTRTRSRTHSSTSTRNAGRKLLDEFKSRPPRRPFSPAATMSSENRRLPKSLMLGDLQTNPR